MRRLLTLATLLGLGSSAAWAETTYCTKMIGALPYTVTTSGNYCLGQNRSLAATTGAAVIVNASFVMIDLNGFMLDGSGAGAVTQAIGISATGRTNVTVRNGTIRGFLRGISITGSPSQGHLIEDVHADGNTLAGVWVEGSGSIVRNNQVSGTGGTTTLANTDTYGIRGLGAGYRVTGNDVTETLGVGTGSGKAILLDAADGAVVEANRPSNATLAIGSTGISLLAGDDILVVGNSLATLDQGVVFGSATGKLRDNLSSGVTLPYSGGSDAGNNQ